MKFLLVVLILAGGVVRADNWPHWRGPHDNGSTETVGAFPTHWSTNNVLWQATLPGRGCSTPIVWEQCIVLTAPVDGKDAVLAFAWDGKPLWQTTLDNERPGKHRNGSGCNPSPVTDGESIFVYFKTRTLAALDWTGKIRWQTNLEPLFGKDTLFWDVGTSPVLTMRHSAMISLRARATIIFVLRAPPGPSVLLWNHLARSLSF